MGHHVTNTVIVEVKDEHTVVTVNSDLYCGAAIDGQVESGDCGQKIEIDN